MENEEHLKILKKGVKVWNEWRKDNPSIKPDLSEGKLWFHGLNQYFSFQDFDLRNVNLRCAQLYDANFSGANLEGSELVGAKLQKSNFSYANLSNTNLIGADFTDANLTNADLSNAYLYDTLMNNANLQHVFLQNTKIFWTALVKTNLSHAKLYHTLFFNTYFRDTDFTKCSTGNTSFIKVDLSETKGLETVIHEGPIMIDIDTIYYSKGKISESFLRGGGIPEIFIKYIPSLVDIKPIHYYSCFISYSSKDEIIAQRLFADLQAKGLRVWFFPESAKWGNSVWGEIDQAILVYDKLIVLCSENSLKSGPVIREIERALAKEDDHLARTGKHKAILFPIRLDDYIIKEWEHPRKIDVVNKYVLGDFRGCLNDIALYQKALDKLMKALETKDE
jgi:hypothetical protein